MDVSGDAKMSEYRSLKKIASDFLEGKSSQHAFASKLGHEAAKNEALAWHLAAAIAAYYRPSEEVQ